MFERFTDEARNLVKGANDEARGLGHRYIGTEHLLLAMLRPHSGAAGPILTGAGLTHDGVRAEIVRLVGDTSFQLGTADAAALEAIGIDLDAVRAKIEETFGPGALDPEPPARRRGLFRRAPQPTTPGHIPFTARSKKVLELSLREALRLKHGFIGSEHILLGLLREGNGLATKVIVDAGVSLDDLRRQAEQALRPAA